MSGQDSSVRNFFGYALMTIGWLIVGTAGLCTTVVVGFGLISLNTSTAAEIFSDAPIPLLFGGIPILVGIVLIYIGRSVLRSAKSPP